MSEYMCHLIHCTVRPWTMDIGWKTCTVEVLFECCYICMLVKCGALWYSIFSLKLRYSSISRLCCGLFSKKSTIWITRLEAPSRVPLPSTSFLDHLVDSHMGS